MSSSPFKGRALDLEVKQDSKQSGCYRRQSLKRQELPRQILEVLGQWVAGPKSAYVIHPDALFVWAQPKEYIFHSCYVCVYRSSCGARASTSTTFIWLELGKEWAEFLEALSPQSASAFTPPNLGGESYLKQLVLQCVLALTRT